MSQFDADEVVPGVWLGGENAARDRQGLRERRILRVLSVHEEPERLGVDDGMLRCHAVRVNDLPAEADLLRAEIPAALSFLREAAIAKEAVLVHCMYGRSRSATVIIAWLMYEKGLSLSEALALVRASRPQAILPASALHV